MNETVPLDAPSADQDTQRRNSTGWMLVLLVVAILLIIFQTDLQTEDQLAATAACLVAITSTWVLARVYPGRWISLGSSFAALFAAFHMGVLLPLTVNSPIQTNLAPADALWINTPGFNSAIVLVAVAQAMFTVGYLLCLQITQRVRTPGVFVKTDLKSPSRTDGPGIIGMVMLVAGIVLWVYNTSVSGASFFGGSYPEFLALTKNTSMSTAYLLMGFGLVLVAASQKYSWRKAALIMFGLWSIPAFLLGLRGEVIIPAAACMIVTARRRPIKLRAWVVLVAIAALAAGSAVRVLRDLSAKSGALNLSIFNPFAGLTELGTSIQTLAIVINSHVQSGEPFVGADTYLAPFRRVIVGRILGQPTLPIENDMSVFSTMVLARVGPIGGSPAAEAYRSGGVLVIVIVMSLIGVIVASLDSMPNNKYSNCLVGMLAFVFLFWVRNDFTPVPTEIFTALGILVCIWMAEQWTGRKPKIATLATNDALRA